MPVECTFAFNRQRLSTLTCLGFGGAAAFSGNGRYISDPNSTAVADEGPLPAGIYYIVDRGGHFGWFWDAVKDVGANTRRADWFALYRVDGKIDDETMIDGVRRGHFRLHPVGRFGESDGCITLASPLQFDKLRAFLKAQRTIRVPGTVLNAYGRVAVR